MNKQKLVTISKDEIRKYINEYYQEELDRIALVMDSIPEPDKMYAIYDMNTGEVTYKNKKISNNKRTVLIKPLTKQRR